MGRIEKETKGMMTILLQVSKALNGTIVLTRETNFDKLSGTQVGMIAPGFACKTSTGDVTLKTAFPAPPFAHPPDESV